MIVAFHFSEVSVLLSFYTKDLSRKSHSSKKEHFNRVFYNIFFSGKKDLKQAFFAQFWDENTFCSCGIGFGEGNSVFNPALAVIVQEGKEVIPFFYRKSAQRSTRLPQAVRSGFPRLPGKSAKAVYILLLLTALSVPLPDVTS